MLSKTELLKVFVVSSECATFREAAIKLNMSPQSVSRIIKTLEDTFGELLFHRNARNIKITKFGEELLFKAQNALQVIDDVFLVNVDESLAGKVTIATPPEIGRDQVYPIIRSIQQRYPDIHICIRASSSYSQLIDEQIDIGIRVGEVKDNRFIVKRINQIRLHLVATPELLNKLGCPHTLDDIKDFPFVDSINSNNGQMWAWEFSQGVVFHPKNIAVSTDNLEIEKQAVLDGLGVGQLPDWLTNEDIKAGRLVRLLDELDPDPWDVYIYRPQRGPVPERVRLIYDAIAEKISELDFQVR